MITLVITKEQASALERLLRPEFDRSATAWGPGDRNQAQAAIRPAFWALEKQENYDARG